MSERVIEPDGFRQAAVEALSVRDPLVYNGGSARFSSTRPNTITRGSLG